MLQTLNLTPDLHFDFIKHETQQRQDSVGSLEAMKTYVSDTATQENVIAILFTKILLISVSSLTLLLRHSSLWAVLEMLEMHWPFPAQLTTHGLDMRCQDEVVTCYQGRKLPSRPPLVFHHNTSWFAHHRTWCTEHTSDVKRGHRRQMWQSDVA